MTEQSGNERGSANANRSSGESRALAGRRPRGLALVLLAGCAPCLLAACDPAPAARSWPAGTLLAIDEVPVSADEIAQDVVAVMLVEPQWGEAQLKRLAFNEIALPRALVRAQASEAARADARRSLDEQFSRIQSGTRFGPPSPSGAIGHEVSGQWKQIGLLAWGTAMALEPGNWSDAIEVPGAFVRVRLLSRQDGVVPAATSLVLDTIEARYAVAPAKTFDLDNAMKQHRLTIIDPAWAAIVPERTKYLMGVHQP